MVRVDELVRRCAAGDGPGWEQLWRIVEGVAAVPIRRLLACYRVDPGVADDLLQEFFLHLSHREAARLRRFRGASERELRGYVAVLALRFARGHLARLRREAARADRAARAWAHAERDDRPAEGRFLAALAELERLLDDVGRAHLRAVLDPAGEPEVPARTRRLWAVSLARQLGDALP